MSMAHYLLVHNLFCYINLQQNKKVTKNHALAGNCVDIRPLWGLFGPYKETNVRVLSLRGPLRETNLCVKAKSVPGTPRIIYIPLLK